MTFEIDDFVQDCRSAIADSAPQLAVRDVVARAVSTPTAIENAKHELAETERRGRASGLIG